VVDNDTPLEKHDHFELVFTNGKRLRLNDPRRFGAVLFSENGSHPLLDSLGVEPLEALFDNEYLYARSRKKQQNIKALIMDRKVVVGVGNTQLFSVGKYQLKMIVFLKRCVIIHHLNRATHTQMNNQCAYLKLNQQILASALYFIDTLI
jgi:hypothetical protein